MIYVKQPKTEKYGEYETPNVVIAGWNKSVFVHYYYYFLPLVSRIPRGLEK